jgi:hypothetical protein
MQFLAGRGEEETFLFGNGSESDGNFGSPPHDNEAEQLYLNIFFHSRTRSTFVALAKCFSCSFSLN